MTRGGNGAGKSTLLGLFAGVLRPVRGEVHDRPARVGWVPEWFPADQPFTVSGYLSTMAALHGAPVSTVEHWISRLGLAELRDEKLSAVSKGTAQKVGLAQALLDEIIRAKPSASKGRYIKKITLSSTMGPGIHVDPARTRDIAEELSDENSSASEVAVG